MIDFPALLVKLNKLPATLAANKYSHMSDQSYGWWSRPGGGIYRLRDFKSASPELVCFTSQFPTGSFLNPELSFEGKNILFAYARHYPHVAGIKNKTDKRNVPEDAFYDVFEMNSDESGLHELTRGRYDDFDARSLLSGVGQGQSKGASGRSGRLNGMGAGRVQPAVSLLRLTLSPSELMGAQNLWSANLSHCFFIFFTNA